MALAGYKVDYDHYFCPICQKVYKEKELCEHYLFNIDDVPYFSDDPEEIEEWKRELEKYEKAREELFELAKSGKIKGLEAWRKRDELRKEYQRVFLEKIVKPREKTKECFRIHLLKAVYDLGDASTVEHDIELDSPLRFKHALEIVDFLEKEGLLKKLFPLRLKRIKRFPEHEGVGSEEVVLSYWEKVDWFRSNWYDLDWKDTRIGMRCIINIYYTTVEEEEQGKTEREEKESG